MTPPPDRMCREHGKRVVGFRGRLLHPDDAPKTWCSPDYRSGVHDPEMTIAPRAGLAFPGPERSS